MHEPNVLPPELTIYTVGEWHPRLLDWVGSGPAADAVDDTLQLDAAAVAEVDAAGLQLLVSLANTLGQQMRPLVLLRPSQPLVEACTLLGATFLLDAAVPTETCA